MIAPVKLCTLIVYMLSPRASRKKAAFAQLTPFAPNFGPKNPKKFTDHESQIRDHFGPQKRARPLLDTFQKKFAKKSNKIKKEVQHEDFPGGHPSQYYSRPSTLNFGVLMGYGALVLVWSHQLTLAYRLYMCFLRHRNLANETPI